jgi:hypothetical protein
VEEEIFWVEMGSERSLHFRLLQAISVGTGLARTVWMILEMLDNNQVSTTSLMEKKTRNHVGNYNMGS